MGTGLGLRLAPWPRAEVLRPPDGHEALPRDTSAATAGPRAPPPCLLSRPTCIDAWLSGVRFLVVAGGTTVVEPEITDMWDTVAVPLVGC